VLADTVALRGRGIDVEELARRVAAACERLAGVARAHTPATLRTAAPGDDAAGRWMRSIPARYGWLVAVDPEPGWMFGLAVTAQHGSSVAENRAVPVFFLGAGVAPGRIARPIRTVDVAPTVAALLGVRPTEQVDGRALPEVTRGATLARTAPPPTR
jgi:arylsulfatase A-like enzyme